MCFRARARSLYSYASKGCVAYLRNIIYWLVVTSVALSRYIASHIPHSFPSHSCLARVLYTNFLLLCMYKYLVSLALFTFRVAWHSFRLMTSPYHANLLLIITYITGSAFKIPLLLIPYLIKSRHSTSAPLIGQDLGLCKIGQEIVS